MSDVEMIDALLRDMGEAWAEVRESDLAGKAARDMDVVGALRDALATLIVYRDTAREIDGAQPYLSGLHLDYRLAERLGK